MVKKSISIQIVIAQINPIVGDVSYNAKKIIEIIRTHSNADLIVFPEMCLVGYPIMDHIFDPLIRQRNEEWIETIKSVKTNATIVLGSFTEPSHLKNTLHPFYNSALIIQDNKIQSIINKRLLPEYDVFDEFRYFSFDNDYTPLDIKGITTGILVCEDIWDDSYNDKVAQKLVSNGAQLLVVINASPFHINKSTLRANLLTRKAKELSVPIVYVNMIGGLDEIVYDGQSIIVDHQGRIIHQCKAFEEDITTFDLTISPDMFYKSVSRNLDWRVEVLKALELNLRDYFLKSNAFTGVVLGLSGGVDSAFTAYICTKALGIDKVHAIMMPTKYTSKKSLDLAKKLCENLQIDYKVHSIDDLFLKYESDLKKNLGDMSFDIADENLQSRIRATILMYYSNKFNWLLVSTGNKSEIGVGYCTLYGDTNGGKNVPGDLFKTQIYAICDYINKEEELIPQGIIERPPTAELRENQKDSDSLPTYDLLDVILEEIMKHGIGSELEALKTKGIDKKIIDRVRNLYLKSEYKRRQLVQSIKISESAFGIGRKYPVLKNIPF
ncbi:MAG: NAD+ synthase [Candidatus Lokiarchaeota archaeon]|nr:NAD+ synthase [Candidatus Lokiarchaeota archaeon]